MCVCERESVCEREREIESVCVYVCACVTDPSTSPYMIESTKNMGRRERRRIDMADTVCPSTSQSSRMAGRATQ